MAGKYRSVQLSRFPLTTVLIIGAVVLFCKPVIKLFKNFYNGLLNGVGFFESFTDMLGLTDNDDVEKWKKSVADPKSFWSPNFHKNAPKGAHLMTYADCETLFVDISKCWGYFSDDFKKIKDLFAKRIGYQSSFSFFCDHLLKNKGFTLRDYLVGGTWPNDRLSEDEISQIHNIILSKPKY